MDSFLLFFLEVTSLSNKGSIRAGKAICLDYWYTVASRKTCFMTSAVTACSPSIFSFMLRRQNTLYIQSYCGN